MKTTIDIPEQALKDAMRFAKVKTKRGAILAALEDFNRRQQMAELITFSGTCKDLMNFDDLMELRERDSTPPAMTLVDTSSWVEQLRPHGEPEVLVRGWSPCCERVKHVGAPR